MNHSLHPFVPDAELTQLPTDLAVLLVGVAARQAASPTAAAQARGLVASVAASALLAPRDGAFNGSMAAALTRWKDG